MTAHVGRQADRSDDARHSRPTPSGGACRPATPLHVAIIAKAPVAGRVKTRLCPPCTPEQAAAIARAALEDTVDAVRALVADEHAAGRPVRPVLLFDGDRPAGLGDEFEVVAQRGDGLGERLGNGFLELGAGLIVGMESPAGIKYLAAGLAALRRGADVLAPAIDGGYWAIGLAAPTADAFDMVPMSTSHTGTAQLRRLHRLGRPVAMLPMLRDLDTPDDLIAARSAPGRLGTIAREVTNGFDPPPPT